MNRRTMGIILVLLSLSIFLPGFFQSPFANSNLIAHNPTAYPIDPYNPNCPCPAFNVTHSQFDLYTSKNETTNIPSLNITFFSAINNTQSGQPVPNTAFTYTMDPANATLAESINYTLSIPRGLGSTTFLKFDWNGTVGVGTRARYLVINGTNFLTPSSPAETLLLNVTKVGLSNPLNFTGGPPSSPIGGVPVSCASTDECYNATSSIGSKLTLAFIFNSALTGKGMKIRVVNIEVASVGTKETVASFHSMSLTSPTQVTHDANVTETYNSTATNVKRFWGQTVTTYYFPRSYTLTSISLNGSIPLSLVYPIAKGYCTPSNCSTLQADALKNMQFIALNDTTIGATPLYPWFSGTAVIAATGPSGEVSVQTTLGGVPTDFWVPGDAVQVKVNETQGVNATGSNIISITSTSPPATNLTQTFSAPTRGVFLFNFTKSLPSSPLGSSWNVTSTFLGNFDYGVVSHVFRMEQIQVSQGTFGYSGDNRRLVVSGTLGYGSNGTLKPSSIIGNVVAIDSGSVPAPTTTRASISGLSPGMYIANTTLLNGAFTSGASLIASFTLVNPTGLRENATITLEHEWVSGQSHGASVTFQLPTGDFPFNPNPTYLYRLNATLTPSGIHVIITSLSSANSVTVNIPPGTPPVTSIRQHSGLFKLSVTSKPLTGSSPCGTPTCTNSIESPVYAYILVNPPLPGRLMASAPITMGSGGAFTATITSGGELGARKLVFYVLGQDPNGVAITTQDKSNPESTLLTATVDNIPTATQGQSMTITMHLQSNSSILNMIITATLNVDGKFVQNTSSINIPHGSKKDVTFNFNAPSDLGVHTFTIFSADYGAPLITGTIQVSVLTSNLQVIIPAVIGLVAAIVILLFFLYRKKPEVVTESMPKDKPASGKPKQNPGSPSSKSLT